MQVHICPMTLSSYVAVSRHINNITPLVFMSVWRVCVLIRVLIAFPIANTCLCMCMACVCEWLSITSASCTSVLLQMVVDRECVDGIG